MKSRRVYAIVSLKDNKVSSTNEGKKVLLYEKCHNHLTYNYFLPVYVNETLEILYSGNISEVFVDGDCQIPLSLCKKL